MKLVAIQHVEEEGLGRIGDLLAERRIDVDLVGPRDPVPALADALIVLGGPMGAYEADRHPRLRDEIRLIESALAARRAVLGICLGSQLLATALGARVTRAPRMEIGWHDVFVESDLLGDVPRSFPALHWHGDVFDVPRGAVHLARSDMTAHQAFSYDGIALGLLFHLEARREQIEAMIRAFPEDVDDPAKLLADTDRFEEHADRIARTIFSRFLDAI